MKRLAVIGDSITRGTYTGENDRCPASIANPRFSDILGERLGFDEVKNYGINGVSISRVSPTNPNFAISKNIDNVAECDMLVIAAGTNDYGNGVPLGTEADGEDISFCGGVRVLMEKVKRRFPCARVVIVTPIKRAGGEKPNAAGYTLSQYRYFLAKLAKEYGFTVVNGDGLGIDPNEEEDKRNYALDGLHLNDLGHRLYAEYILSQI